MAASSQVIVDGSKYHIVHLTNVGTTESGVVKVDASALGNPAGGTGGQTFSLMEIWYDVQGFAYVQLAWDAGTDDVMVTLSNGSGYLDFAYEGGLPDPKSASYTGDVKLTTPAAGATDTYTITAVFKKKLDN